MMAEKPILFSGEMVRAILNGRKTQTRRVITPPNNLTAWEFYPNKDGRTGIWCNDANFVLSCKSGGLAKSQQDRLVSCPYGCPGDLLWVRETWSSSTESGYIYKPSEGHRIWYRAANNRPTWAGGRWRPSIFMPRWASRITLRVTDVRVERVQDISEADAQREGWFFQNHDLSKRYDPVTMDTARQWFSGLWDSINVKRGYGWDVNPFIWVVSFEVVR